jgi:hypothetical protein
MDLPGRNDEDLLGHFLGQVMPAARERDAKPVHRVEVPLEQLPPRLLAAGLCGMYRKRLGLVRSAGGWLAPQVGIPVH